MNTKLKTLDVAFYITNISSTCTGTPTFNLYELVVCSSLMHFHTGLGFRLGFRLGLGLGLGLRCENALVPFVLTGTKIWHVQVTCTTVSQEHWSSLCKTSQVRHCRTLQSDISDFLTTSRGFYSSININPFPPRGFPLMSKILGH